MVQIDVTTIAFIGVFIGILCRTLLPYIKKLKAAQEKEPPETVKFDLKYVWTAIVSLFISLIASMLIFPSFTIPTGAQFYVFLQSFIFGWASNDIINQLIA